MGNLSERLNAPGPGPEDQPQWWDYADQVAELVQYLADTDQITIEQVAYLLEKPWKWQDEYNAMRWQNMDVICYYCSGVFKRKETKNVHGHKSCLKCAA